MIWGDDWTQIATQKGGPGRFCTTIPPPRTPLPDGATFRLLREPTQEWLDLVGTRWLSEEASLRLAGAYIPCIFEGGVLKASCVMRFLAEERIWVLETLRARKGWGRSLLRAVIPWIWSREGPFIMAYTWELSLPALIFAWWRGWLRSASQIQYGWALSANGESCTFCPGKWQPLGPRLAMPTAFRDDASGGAIVSDSGLGDGWGNVIAFDGEPDWPAIAKKGGWKQFWMRSAVRPGSLWSWTGEFVVVGLLNYNSGPVPRAWITAEI